MNIGSPDATAVSAVVAGFNLSAAIINIVNPAGAIVGYTHDLLRWLDRSGVDEKNFEQCMKAARGLAHPNHNDMVLSGSISKADKRLQNLKKGQLPLALTFSQALGRLIVQEPDVCYMASITACLLRHHDMAYATSALTSMVLDKGGHETETKHDYEVWRAPTRAVIAKVVESIFLDISNPGHQTEPFPPELANLHVHVLDDANFAAIAMQIQRTLSDLLLQADRFPGDIILWLLNHFEGHLEDDHETCNGRSWPVVLAEIIDGKPRRLVGGSSAEYLKPCSYQRQKLYMTENLMNTTYISLKTYLNKDRKMKSYTLLGLCILLSHAVADALGANDVSGNPDPPEGTISGVMTLLSEVIDQDVVRWNTWFQVGACAVSGCPWALYASGSRSPEIRPSTSLVGVQYGSLIVLAPWLDFNAPLDINGAFRIRVFEGLVQGVNDDIACIETEEMSKIQQRQDLNRMDVEKNPWKRITDIDNTPFGVQKAVFRAERDVYRLLVIVKVNKQLRLVDPTQSIMALSRSHQAACCGHRRSDDTPEQLREMLDLSGSNINVVTLEDIFTSWE
ncbi:MAG: hypothetical protein Q9225_006535, partial [Loekoesia sp. 1 TL-2023]